MQTSEPSPTETNVARRWGRAFLGGAPDFISTTLESAHHRDSSGDFMLEEGYLQWGGAIGRAFNKVLGGTELPLHAPPRACFTHLASGAFDASASTAPGSSALTYHWNFGDGSQTITTGPQTTHTFSGTGHFPVSLRVINEAGVASPAFSLPVLVQAGGTEPDPDPDPPPPFSPTPEATLLIDFGNSAATPTVGGAWNTIPGAPPSVASGLVYADGSPAAGLSLAFANFDTTTLNQGFWPAGDREWVDARATADYIWRGSGQTATITVHGLDPAKAYGLDLVAARAVGDNRMGAHRVQGMATDLDVASTTFHARVDGWLAGGILRWRGVVPDSEGRIVVSLTPASGMTVNINALRLAPEMVTVATAYDEWRELHFSPSQQNDPAVSGPFATPVGDGLTNLFRFAAGCGPFEHAHHRLPQSSSVENDGDRHLEFTFYQRTGGTGNPGLGYTADGVRYAVEFRADLSEGSWALHDPAGDPFMEATTLPLDQGDGTARVTLRLRQALTEALPQAFLRLRLTWEIP